MCACACVKGTLDLNIIIIYISGPSLVGPRFIFLYIYIYYIYDRHAGSVVLNVFVSCSVIKEHDIINVLNIQSVIIILYVYGVKNTYAYYSLENIFHRYLNILEPTVVNIYLINSRLFFINSLLYIFILI